MTLQLEKIQTESLDLRPIQFNQVNEILDRNGLNWEVETKPLYLDGGFRTPFLGVVRTDNNTTFQTVSKVYEPMQNRELVEIGLQISELTGAEMEVTKTLSNGAVTYISLNGGQTKIEGAKRGDVVGEKITLVNSHDGSKSFGVGFGHVILSCTNGMTRFDRKGFVSIRHTSNMKRKLKDVLNGWKRISQESSNMIESYKRLMDKQIGTKEIQKVLEIVAEVDPSASMDSLSTRKQNITKSVWESLSSEMSYKGQTAWGLLNGVTHYTTRISGKNDSALKSKMFGQTAKKDFTVWNYLNQL